MKIRDIYMEDCDDSVLWVCVANKRGETCYTSVVSDEYILHGGDMDNLHSQASYHVCERLLRERNFNVENIPSVSLATPAVRYLMKQIRFSEQTMLFIEEEDMVFNILGIAKEEFETQVDSDVEKFGLQDVVVKGEDGTLYTIYGDFMGRFMY